MSTVFYSGNGPIYLVPPSRLAHGKYQDGRMVGEGDIPASYSGDRIGESKPIRQPFEWQDCLWVCVGSFGAGLTITKEHEFTAFRLGLKEAFAGEAVSYRERTATEQLRAAARNDPNGFYHGVLTNFRSTTFVLCGPGATFMADMSINETASNSGVQLGLF